jgi:hypothetical protein
MFVFGRFILENCIAGTGRVRMDLIDILSEGVK